MVPSDPQDTNFLQGIEKYLQKIHYPKRNFNRYAPNGMTSAQ